MLREDFIGKVVVNKVFGKGIVKDIDEKHMIVDFNGVNKKFISLITNDNWVGNVKIFIDVMKFEDENLQKNIDKYFLDMGGKEYLTYIENYKKVRERFSGKLVLR